MRIYIAVSCSGHPPKVYGSASYSAICRAALSHKVTSGQTMFIETIELIEDDKPTTTQADGSE